MCACMCVCVCETLELLRGKDPDCLYWIYLINHQGPSEPDATDAGDKDTRQRNEEIDFHPTY